MDSKQIKELLEKYWECETSVEEEQALKAYFNSDQVAADLMEFKPLFVFFKKEQAAVLPANFDQEFETKLQERKPKSSRLFLNLTRVAASLLIILTCSYFYYNHYEEQKVQISLLEDTYQDPEVAYQEMKKALFQVSKQLNSGTKYVISIKQINEGAKYFKEDQKIER